MNRFVHYLRYLWPVIHQRREKATERWAIHILGIGLGHRCLMSRLSLQVFYLWRHVLTQAPPFILWWSNLEILFGPLHRSSPSIGELRCQAIQTELGPYIAERTQKAVYIVRCLLVGRRQVSHYFFFFFAKVFATCDFHFGDKFTQKCPEHKIVALTKIENY
jgi:hypothetical protein